MPLPHYVKRFLSWLLPYTCVLCGDSSHTGKDLCHGCTQDLPELGQHCYQCAQVLTMPTHQHSLCGDCLKQAPPYRKMLALWRYEQPIDYLVTQLKFQHQLVYAQLLGELLTEKLIRHYPPHDRPQCIIPVPLHPQRLQQRGYNQAVEIARPIAKKLGITLDISSCQRIKPTAAQSSIPAENRRHNVKNAFVVTSKQPLKHVAIVDDVVTTGHTVAALAQALRNAGTTTIDVWCCARTSRQ